MEAVCHTAHHHLAGRICRHPTDDDQPRRAGFQPNRPRPSPRHRRRCGDSEVGGSLNPVARLAGAFIVTDAALYRAHGMNVPVYRPSVPEDFWTPHLYAVAGRVRISLRRNALRSLPHSSDRGSRSKSKTGEPFSLWNIQRAILRRAPDRTGSSRRSHYQSRVQVDPPRHNAA